MSSDRDKTHITAIPSIDRVLQDSDMRSIIATYSRQTSIEVLREMMAEYRELSLSGFSIAEKVTIEAIITEAARRLDHLTSPSLRPVLNLSGTVLHTNLGRATLPPEAIQAMADVSVGPSNLEYDLKKGTRGHRDDHIASLICRLTGAESACVVNNNAAALILILNTFGLSREILLSRGELIEIGGTFRIPDMISRAGASLREVGTTNRTHLKDFELAIAEDTAMILKVHNSNFEIRGFTSSVPEQELAALAHTKDIPFTVDLGSGTLIDLSEYGMPKEPTVRETLLYGADLVCFSADKLLGGPQAGIIVGKTKLINKINANPLKRAMRLDKVIIAALQAVLRIYLSPDALTTRLPTLRHLYRSCENIQSMAESILPTIATELRNVAQVEIVDCESQPGSGALPTTFLPSKGLSITPKLLKESNTRKRAPNINDIAKSFRLLSVPVIGKLNNGKLILDLRCLETADDLTGQMPALRKILEGGLLSNSVP